MQIFTTSIARAALLTIAVTTLLAAGCDDASAPGADASAAAAAPTSVHGAWLGEGTFNAEAGTTEVTAQLELLSDGTYRFMILQPRVLALAGAEKGQWTTQGSTLHLKPDEEKPATPNPQTGEKPSVMDVLRSSSPRELREKDLSVANDFSSLTLDDGKMQLRFRPNPTATAKLKAAGEI